MFDLNPWVDFNEIESTSIIFKGELDCSSILISNMLAKSKGTKASSLVPLGDWHEFIRSVIPSLSVAIPPGHALAGPAASLVDSFQVSLQSLSPLLPPANKVFKNAFATIIPP
jgi:hypothetical protein